MTSPDSVPRSARAIETRRLIFADAATVYGALTRATEVRHWFVPGESLTCVAAELDVRDGGAYRIVIATPEDQQLQVTGSYQKVRAPRELAFDWHFKDAVSRVWIGLESRGSYCELVLLHTDIDPAQVAIYEGIWARLLHHLERHVGSGTEAFARHFTRAEGFRSRFGGFWTDRPDAHDRVAQRQRNGAVSEPEAALLRRWIDQGFVSLPGAVPHATIDAILQDIDQAWANPRPDLFVEHYTDGRLNFSPIRTELRDRPHKLLDFHAISEAAQAAVFAEPVMRFLAVLFEGPPVAFQSLTFITGSEQDMHQDTAFVALRSPMEFVGCWIALEDVREGAGELQYYEGSHRIEEFLFDDACRAMPPGVIDQQPYLDSLHVKCKAMGSPLVRHAPKKGDVLLWHADLVHGGAPIGDQTATRRSFVVHLCPSDNQPACFAWTPHTELRRHQSGGFTCCVLRG